MANKIARYDLSPERNPDGSHHCTAVHWLPRMRTNKSFPTQTAAQNCLSYRLSDVTDSPFVVPRRSALTRAARLGDPLVDAIDTGHERSSVDHSRREDDGCDGDGDRGRGARRRQTRVTRRRRLRRSDGRDGGEWPALRDGFAELLWSAALGPPIPRSGPP